MNSDFLKQAAEVQAQVKQYTTDAYLQSRRRLLYRLHHGLPVASIRSARSPLHLPDPMAPLLEPEMVPIYGEEAVEMITKVEKEMEDYIKNQYPLLCK